ncbi:MAG: acyl--CoA ligase [Rhodobacteraceae bacterium]|nr:acyl--CoA ligase [Paracoccaceae bacterium]
MRSVVDTGPFPPCPAPFNLTAHVLAHADRLANKTALAVVDPNVVERWSYARLNRAVLGAAGGLQAMRLPTGAPVLMRIGNAVEFPLAFLACIAAGLMPVPTSAQLTGPEITAMARQIAPALILAAPGVALPEAPACPVIDMKAFVAMEAHAPASPVLGDPDRPAYIVFTSGTSGRPRAVIHAHRAIWARRMMREGWDGLSAADAMFHAGALNWTFTLGTGLLDPWSVGATALITSEGTASSALPGLISHHGATIFAAAPGIYRQMLKAPMPALPKLRHGLSAGEKLPEAVRTAWHSATALSMHEAFGMSECSTFLSGSPARPAPSGSSGYAQPGRHLALIGPDNTPVPRGKPGTIAVHRSDPGLMLGYLGAEAETRARFTPDGTWFLTGDQAVMAKDGAITYLGRGDDMLNAGGFRVSPLEIERAFATHPSIDEAAAVEIAVKADVRVIALFYTGPETLDDGQLLAFAAGRIARYKTPRLFRHCAALPRNPNGKLARRRLREEHEARHGIA